MRWRSPAVSNRVIAHFTVYAIPLFDTYRTNTTTNHTDGTTDNSDLEDNNPLHALPCMQVFPGSARSGIITLVDHSITYQFRVSASVMLAQTFNEGELSVVTPSATLFVPEPGPGTHWSDSRGYLLICQYLNNYRTFNV